MAARRPTQAIRRRGFRTRSATRGRAQKPRVSALTHGPRAARGCQVHLYMGCCMYYLQMYEQAEKEATK